MVRTLHSPALVTGAGSGIGAAVCALLAERGHRIVAVDVDSEAATRTAQGLPGSIAIGADVTDSASLGVAVDRAVSQFGGLGVVVAAAGTIMIGTAVDTPEAEWRRVFDVNATGVFLAAQATVPILLKRGGGAFVAIGSDACFRGSAGFTAYCASKHALLGLIRCMALEFGAGGVRRNVVCPSFTDTPMADRIFDHLPDLNREQYAASRTMGRLARPEEVARVVAHLASDDASYTNGCAYAMDGGLTAG